MPRITQPVLLLVLFLLPLNWPAYHASAQDSQRPKKLIATGWDHVDPQRLAANLQEMEGRPFDGVVIRIAGQTPEGRSVPLPWAFQKDRWEQAWFQESVEILRQVRSDKLTDNFVLLNANPGNVDWFDDEGWTAVVEHCRIAAWCAKQGGAKGILFDPEPYAPPNAAFHYGAQPQREEHSFDQYYGQARLRGRQMMQAIAGEYPEVTIFCYFMNSVVASATGRADPRPALKSSHYGLYPALIDGWLDAAPPAATFVDGCESAYRYNSTEQYLESAVAIKGACQELVSPENRAKYRAQVQVSFGIYLDAYWNPKDSEWGTWYIDGLGRPRIERLRTNAATALQVADEYVWIYGEKFRWWPTPNGRVRQETWPEALPGCDKVLAYVRDPVEYARRELADLERNGAIPNLLANGDFTSETAAASDGKQVSWSPGRPPAGWSAWQEADSKGDFTWDREVGLGTAGSARASGVAGGCFLQGCPAAAGDRFAVRGHVRTEGTSDVWIRVRWQTDESKWTAETKDRIFMPQASAGPWREILGVVEIPEGAARLVVLLGVAGQAGAEDVAWFDDVLLYRLP